MFIKSTKLLLLIGFLIIPYCKAISQSSLNPLPSNTLIGESSSIQSEGLLSPYTGLPNIEFKLFEYSKNGLNLRAALTYNSIGTTVEQMASPAGLGWNTNIECFVKRSVINMPDDFSYTQNFIKKNVGYLTTPNIPTNPNRNDLDDQFYNRIDKEEDIYSFQIPGYSGRILINKNYQVVGTSPKSDLNISLQKSLDAIDEFEIKTPEGIVYKFSVKETQHYKTKIDGNEFYYDYTSTWLPKKIYSCLTPNSQITFTYDEYYSNEIIGSQKFNSLPQNSSDLTMLSSIFYGTGGGCNLIAFQFLDEDLKINGGIKRINQIDFPNGSKIVYNYSATTRCDAQYDKALLSIDIFNEIGLRTKSILLDYSYMTSSGEISFANCSTFSLSNRLILKKITEKGSGSQTLPPTEFFYETSMTLPSRTDRNVDAWGFYPASLSFPNGQAEAYILKKIRFPTGSTKEFIYERNIIGWTKNSNTDEIINGLRVKKIITSENNLTNDSYETQYTYSTANETSSGELDYKPFGKFTTYLDLNYVSETCTLPNGEFSNTPYSNNTNHSPIQPFPVGGACGYSRVIEEKIKGNTTLGKSIYYFKNFSDYITHPALSGVQGDMQFPFAAKQYNIPWGLGLNYKTEIYDNNNALLKRIEKDYSVTAWRINSADLASMKIGMWYGPLNRSNSAMNGEVYKYDIYYPLQGETKLLKTTQTDFFTNVSPAQNVKSEVINKYVLNKNLIRSSEYFDDNNNLVITYYKYPFDFSSVSYTNNPAINLMNLNGITNEIVSTETWITKNGNDYLTSSKIFQYAVLNNGMVKLSKEYSIKTTTPLDASSFIPYDGITIPALYSEDAAYNNFDNNGNCLQTTEKGYKLTSIIYDKYNSPVATIFNAPSNKVAYTSFENINTYIAGQKTGNFNIINGSIYSESMTGEKSFKGALSTLMVSGSYILTMWTKYSDNVSVSANGTSLIGTKILIKHRKGWNLYQWNIDITSGSATITISSGFTVIDEVRLYPKLAQMNTLSYDLQYNKISSCDATNTINTNTFDEFGRIILVRDESDNILKKICYNYYNNATNNCETPLYLNSARCVIYNRNNCSANEFGAERSANVASGQFSSKISQADADAKAEAYLQNKINTEGACLANAGLYARLEVELVGSNNGNAGGLYWYSDIAAVYLRFYSDPQCTQAYTLTSDVMFKFSTRSINKDSDGNIIWDEWSNDWIMQTDYTHASNEQLIDNIFPYYTKEIDYDNLNIFGEPSIVEYSMHFHATPYSSGSFIMRPMIYKFTPLPEYHYIDYNFPSCN